MINNYVCKRCVNQKQTSMLEKLTNLTFNLQNYTKYSATIIAYYTSHNVPVYANWT